MAKNMQNPEPLTPTITVAEVAELLRLSAESIYDKVRRNELPGVLRFGRTIRFRRSAIEALLSGAGRMGA